MIYTTKLPNGTVDALRVLGIPIPVTYTDHHPVVLEHWLPGQSFQANRRIKSRPWDGAVEIHWESGEELSTEDLEHLKNTWEAPHIRECDLRMATTICDLQRQIKENHSGLAERLQKDGIRVCQRLDVVEESVREEGLRLNVLCQTENEHFHADGLSLADMESDISDLRQLFKEHFPDVKLPRRMVDVRKHKKGGNK